MYIIYTYMCVYVYDFPSPLELGYESRPIASQAAEAGSWVYSSYNKDIVQVLWRCQVHRERGELGVNRLRIKFLFLKNLKTGHLDGSVS